MTYMPKSKMNVNKNMYHMSEQILGNEIFSIFHVSRQQQIKYNKQANRCRIQFIQYLFYLFCHFQRLPLSSAPINIIINKSLMYFEDEIKLPALIPIKSKRKKKQQQEATQQNNLFIGDQAINILAKEFEKQSEERDAKKQEKSNKPSLGPEKIEQISKKFNNLQEKDSSKKQERSTKKENNKQKENQKSKHIVAQMMHKINAKNVAQQLYPVTNESILSDIRQLDKQVELLTVEAERKENYLVTNPNNQHLKKQLETLKISIDRCVTIKELYNQKINLRNKVSVLERDIIELREENQNLKIKKNRQVEDQDSHSNGLPCYRQIQLKDQLTKCQQQLQRQKDMKEKLEKNVNDIVLNFKRLYEEADMARQVVIKKLKEIQQKQKRLNESQASLSEKSVIQNQKNEAVDNRKRVQTQHSHPQPDNDKTIRKANQIIYAPPQQYKQPQKTYSKPNPLEEQILKMRGNQNKSKYRCQ